MLQIVGKHSVLPWKMSFSFGHILLCNVVLRVLEVWGVFLFACCCLFVVFFNYLLFFLSSYALIWLIMVCVFNRRVFVFNNFAVISATFFFLLPETR